MLARGPNEQAEMAKELYKSGMKLVEIASQLNVPPGSVRRWKSTYKWDNERSDNKSERSDKKNRVKKENVVNEVKKVLDNTELTDKQRLFCLYFARSFNATRSYQKAYGCDYMSANAQGSRLLAKDSIKEEIMRLKEERYTRALLTEEDIFQKYMDIAFADVTDFVEFGNKEVQYEDDLGNEQTAILSYVNIKHDSEIDGTIVTEVSKGKDGVKVKLADRMKALQWLTEHMNMATEEQKARIAVLKARANIDDGEEREQDDGFLDALNGSAREDWSDEESD